MARVRQAKTVVALLVVWMIVAGACSGSAPTSTTPDASDAVAIEVEPSATATSIPTLEPESTPEPEPTAHGDPQPADGIDQGVLDELLETSHRRDRGGIIALVAVANSQTASAIGDADETGRPMESDTPMYVGSISKTFTATMVMQLAEEGAIDLDATLSTYLPGVIVGGDSTIRSILSHTGGLANYTDSFRFGARLTEIATGGEDTTTFDELLDWASRDTAPAEGVFSYANTGYLLLGLMIEQVDGRSLNDSLEARITEPLALSVTRYGIADRPDPDNLAAPWARQVRLEGPVGFEFTRAMSGWSDGSLITTAGELTIFLRALFDGTLVDAQSLEAMTVIESGPAGNGLGLFAARIGGDTWWGHSGANLAFRASAMIHPESGDVVVAMVNADTAPDPDGMVRQLIGLRNDALAG